MAIKKVLVGLDEEQIKDIDSYAEAMHISRSSAVRILTTQSLQAQKTMTSLDDLMNAYKAEKAKQMLSAGAEV